MRSLATRLARQRALVDRLRQSLAFEVLVLERLERRSAPERAAERAADRPSEIAAVLDRARRRHAAEHRT